MGSLRFMLVIVGMGLVFVLFARIVLLRIGLWLQRTRGFSNEFVTELAIGLPLAVYIVTIMIWVGWLSK